MQTRREFIAAGATLLGAGVAGAIPPIEPAANKLDILFLGGTGFLGPHQINRALDRGHSVTMFNRGTHSGLFGDRVEELVGNRDNNIDDGLGILKGHRTWDVVVDNSGYVPRHVRDSVELLKDRCRRYIFISTASVYDYLRQERVDENGPLLPAPETATEDSRAYYGPLKAECDRIVRQVLGDRATVVRPPYVIGPGDHTDRFTYWVDRFHRGGDIVCPAGPDLNCVWIDARDLCHWIITLAENDTPGAFNASGPVAPMSNRQVMWALRGFSNGKVALHWPEAELLTELGFSTPMFRHTPYSRHLDSSSSRAAGLSHRSLAESTQDTWVWWMKQTSDRRANARRWPTREQEQAVLARL